MADLAGGTIYFLYNPFGPATVRTVLEKIPSFRDDLTQMAVRKVSNPLVD